MNILSRLKEQPSARRFASKKATFGSPVSSRLALQRCETSHQPQICREGAGRNMVLPPRVRWERSNQGWGRLGRCPTASPEPAGHLCSPGRQRGHELSAPVTGMDLKIKMHDTLLGRKSAEKAHLCFVLSFQFESDLQIFLACNQPSYSL